MQAEWYGREDFTLETAINSLQDKSTVLLPWFYSWPVDSPSVQGTLHGASFKASGAEGHSPVDLHSHAPPIVHRDLKVGFTREREGRTARAPNA